jgi:predicted alpha/beta hydrolase family esterase
MKTAMQQLDKDRDEMLTYLIEHLETDTLSIAPYMDAANVLMVMARFDWAVPYQKQLELREALGNPEAITLPTGHITAAFYIPYLRKKALNFFDRRLTLPAEEPGSRILAGGDRPLVAESGQ